MKVKPVVLITPGATGGGDFPFFEGGVEMSMIGGSVVAATSSGRVTGVVLPDGIVPEPLIAEVDLNPGLSIRLLNLEISEAVDWILEAFQGFPLEAGGTRASDDDLEKGGG